MTETNEALAAQTRQADMIEGVVFDILAHSELPAGQQKAIRALMFGQTPMTAARAAKVHRGTLYRWMRHDPAFADALAECRTAMHADAREQLTSLMSDCVDHVYNAVIDGDRNMAYKLLKAMGVIDRRSCEARRKAHEAAVAPPGGILVSGEGSRITECCSKLGATNADLSRGLFLAQPSAGT